MARLFSQSQLPHFDSTRDTRDRLDLVTDNVPVGAKWLKADRIIYHPGDTCAKHYHIGCHHLFYVLQGEGLIFTDQGSQRLKPGMAAIVQPEELHWFENDTDENFIFVEFWAPPPEDTIWIVKDDI
ncbi:MAG: cupin domain-containing protein [Anaerolineae bacterium]|nr:cupin domain-containing protein [Anaerolineae bacterium]